MSFDVYAANSPLQLLNALEAQRAFVSPRRALVVVAAPGLWAQLEPLIAADDWDEVHRVEVGAPKSAMAKRYATVVNGARVRKELDLIARRWPKVDRLFLGNLNKAYLRHLANVVDHRELVVLDDGTGTIDIAHRRAKGVARPAVGWRTLRMALRERLMGARGREPDRLVFFTSYDVRVGPDDTVVRNGYARLRAQVTRAGVGDEVLFLGQPLVGTGEMRADRYVAYLRAARDRFGRDDFVYVPHRHESLDQIERVRAELGVAVRRPDVPIEVELIRSGELPRVLASFFSSALDNCRLMFGDVGMQIRALEIEPAHLERNHAFVDRVYTYLRAHRGDGLDVEALRLPVVAAGIAIAPRADATGDRSSPSTRSEAWRS